jgi:hypothetical protein
VFNYLGEAVWAGTDGKSDFDKLHSGAHDGGVFLYAFDLLELNSEDYRQHPLEMRKAKLEKILARTQGMRFKACTSTTHCPRPHVRHCNAVLCFLGVGLDPDRLLTPLAGPRPFALLDRKPNDWNAEGIDRFLAALRPLIKRLVQYVVVRAAQAAADNLLCEER